MILSLLTSIIDSTSKSIIKDKYLSRKQAKYVTGNLEMMIIVANSF
jgi:hypothetical protein